MDNVEFNDKEKEPFTLSEKIIFAASLNNFRWLSHKLNNNRLNMSAAVIIVSKAAMAFGDMPGMEIRGGLLLPISI